MGIHCLNAVIYGLKDAERAIGSTGSGKTKHTFGAADMAMLLVLAHRQPDPGEVHDDPDSIAYINAANLSALAHVTDPFRIRKFLVEKELISYTESEKHGPTGKTYNYVYRIRLDTIRRLSAGDDENRWIDEILHLNRRRLDLLSDEIRQAYALTPSNALVRHDSTHVQHDTRLVRHDSSIVQHDTNNKLNKTINSELRQTTGDACDKQWEDEFGRFWDAYPGPRKCDKIKCFRRFKEILAGLDEKKRDETLKAIFSGLERWKHSHDWVRDKGAYICSPFVWLNNERWHDDVKPYIPPRNNGTHADNWRPTRPEDIEHVF